MCDGQPADNCDIMKLEEFEYNLNVQLTKVNKQFATMKDFLEAKKEALIEIYRKDPRISHDDAVSSLEKTIEDFDPFNPVSERMIEQQEKLRKQLAQQQEIAAQVEEMKTRLAKTQQEKSNQEKRLNELQSILDTETRDKSSLKKELNQIKALYSNLEIENQKLTKDLKAVTLSRSETEGERKRLEGILQETQTRLQDAERVKAKETARIKQMNETKQIIVCKGFDFGNEGVRISGCKRSVKGNMSGLHYKGFCFLKHPKLSWNQILKWTLRIPKFRRGAIGMVITLEQIIFDFLKIIF